MWHKQKKSYFIFFWLIYTCVAQILNSGTNGWSTDLLALVDSRGGVSAKIVLDRYIIIFGGAQCFDGNVNGHSGSTSDCFSNYQGSVRVDIYDTWTATWSVTRFPGSAMVYSSMLAYKDSFFIVGGVTFYQGYRFNFNYEDKEICVTQSAIFQFNMTTGVWSTMDFSLPLARGAMGAAIVNDKMFLIGGIASFSTFPAYCACVNNVDMIDLITGEVTSLQPPTNTTGLCLTAATVVGNDIEFGGGFFTTVDYEAYGSVWILDTTQPDIINTTYWTAHAMSKPRADAQVVTVESEDDVLVCWVGSVGTVTLLDSIANYALTCAWGQNGIGGETTCLSTKTRQWMDIPLPVDRTTRACTSVTSWKNLLIFIGGSADLPFALGNTVFQANNYVDMYDFNTGTWLERVYLPRHGMEFTVITLGDKVHVIGGYTLVNGVFVRSTEMDVFAMPTLTVSASNSQPLTVRVDNTSFTLTFAPVNSTSGDVTERWITPVSVARDFLGEPVFAPVQVPLQGGQIVFPGFQPATGMRFVGSNGGNDQYSVPSYSSTFVTGTIADRISKAPEVTPGNMTALLKWLPPFNGQSPIHYCNIYICPQFNSSPIPRHLLSRLARRQRLPNEEEENDDNNSNVFVEEGDCIVVRADPGAAILGFLIPDLVSGTNYTFAVSSKNDVGTSPVSPFTPWTLIPGPPHAPSFVLATADTDKFMVTFGTPLNTGGLDILSYQVCCTNASVGCQTINPDKSELKAEFANGFTRGVGYQFYVIPFNQDGEGTASSLTAPVQLAAQPSLECSPLSITSWECLYGYVWALIGLFTLGMTYFSYKTYEVIRDGPRYVFIPKEECKLELRMVGNTRTAFVFQGLIDHPCKKCCPFAKCRPRDLPAAFKSIDYLEQDKINITTFLNQLMWANTNICGHCCRRWNDCCGVSTAGLSLTRLWSCLCRREHPNIVPMFGYTRMVPKVPGQVDKDFDGNPIPDPPETDMFIVKWIENSMIDKRSPDNLREEFGNLSHFVFFAERLFSVIAFLYDHDICVLDIKPANVTTNGSAAPIVIDIDGVRLSLYNKKWNQLKRQTCCFKRDLPDVQEPLLDDEEKEAMKGWHVKDIRNAIRILGLILFGLSDSVREWDGEDQLSSEEEQDTFMVSAFQQLARREPSLNTIAETLSGLLRRDQQQVETNKAQEIQREFNRVRRAIGGRNIQIQIRDTVIRRVVREDFDEKEVLEEKVVK